MRRRGTGNVGLSSEDVVLGSTNLQLGFHLPEIPPLGSWFRFELPLHESSGWTNLNAQRLATRDEFLATLAALNHLWIRAEFTPNTDASDLDQVALLGQPSGPLQPALTLNQYPEIWISGAVGRTYRIEYLDALGSTNVWQQLVTLVMPTSPHRFIDPAATGVSRRFYRAVLEP